ncbi:hypothetical protein QBC42DRAFT_349134 [Cladorrhinum samala]|uniref:Uncharacterized protein n=1 Tax=Cladorrhinum samala TaxID=585594 RepID=A0AAV9HE07_9PEZI|nr:hypothetical protein QBC42DRAFT_349134 [Cladorrhinum samala]
MTLLSFQSMDDVEGDLEPSLGYAKQSLTPHSGNAWGKLVEGGDTQQLEGGTNLKTCLVPDIFFHTRTGNLITTRTGTLEKMQSSRHAQSSSSSSASMQRRGGRAPSNHHHLSRLRPAEIDPLAEYGLPSKGEKRLLSFKVQESYYTRIVERYLAFCTEAGDPSNLQKQLARSDPSPPSSSSPTPDFTSPLPSPASTTGALPDFASPSASTGISQILSALRKMREAIVASKRRDAFSAQVYLFAIRCGILASAYETYYPALLYLLRGIHPVHSLTSVELNEVVSYLVLDTACRRGDLASAYALRNKHKLKDGKVDGVLKALAGDNWFVWRRMRRRVDGYKAKIMEFAEKEMKEQTLKAFRRAYLTVPLEYLERAVDETWDVLKNKYNIEWDLTGEGKVIIRKVPARTG